MSAVSVLCGCDLVQEVNSRFLTGPLARFGMTKGAGYFAVVASSATALRK